MDCLRVRGSYKGQHGEIAAHTSAVQVVVGRTRFFHRRMRRRFWNKLRGQLPIWIRSPPRPEARRLKQMRATLEAAHNRLHQQMHKHGIYHDHTPLHDHGHEH